jgi:hypothetical protein
VSPAELLALFIVGVREYARKAPKQPSVLAQSPKQPYRGDQTDGTKGRSAPKRVVAEPRHRNPLVTETAAINETFRSDLWQLYGGCFRDGTCSHSGGRSGPVRAMLLR